MNAYQNFERTFTQDHCMMSNDVELILKKEDGYINAGALCSAGDKKFTNWLCNRRSKELLKELETELNKPLIELSRSENRHGTYVHPFVALDIAQWISPQFSVKVTVWIWELFMKGFNCTYIRCASLRKFHLKQK